MTISALSSDVPILSTTDLAGQTLKSSGVCGRACPYWRMSAGILCLAASIIALFSAILWNTPWLCLPFGIGAFSSAFAIYQGYEFHRKQGYKRLQEQFRAENTRLHGEVDDLKTTKDQLNTMLETERKAREELNSQLRNEIKALEDEHTTFINKANAHVKDLKSAQISLSGILTSVEDDHTKFGPHVEKFTENLKKLGEFASALSDLTQEWNITYKMLCDAFKGIDDWKDATHQREIEQREMLNKIIREQNQEHLQLVTKLTELKKDIEFLNESKERLNQDTESKNQQLKKTSEHLQAVLDTLSSNIQKGTNDLTTAREEIAKAVNELKNRNSG